TTPPQTALASASNLLSPSTRHTPVAPHPLNSDAAHTLPTYPPSLSAAATSPSLPCAARDRACLAPPHPSTPPAPASVPPPLPRPGCKSPSQSPRHRSSTTRCSPAGSHQPPAPAPTPHRAAPPPPMPAAPATPAPPPLAPSPDTPRPELPFLPLPA